MTFIYQVRQIREFERLAAEKYQLTAHDLMQRAGKGARDYLQKRWPQAKTILVCCGSGNNGGDGEVLAGLLHEQGYSVTIWQIGQPTGRPLPALPFQGYDSSLSVPAVDLIVDAICGIGLKHDLRDETKALVMKIQDAHLPILSLDVPTGIDADTGRACGLALQATATITFIGHKLGLLTGHGVGCTGELVCDDLQLPAALLAEIPPVAETIVADCATTWLQPRRRDWHKGKSGHVLVIGGESGFAGASRMAGEAALRIGAGLVSVGTRPAHAIALTVARPELMCHGISSARDLAALIKRADVIVLGPGLGQTAWSHEIWSCVSQVPCSLVMDADGLNLLAQHPFQRQDWILTPHPGEAARLLGLDVASVQADRLVACKSIQQRYGGVCVLKGAGSLVIAQDGYPCVCTRGNPGMATAGMGDILSGVIGGLLAQGIPLKEAAKLGVWLHAVAGDDTAREGERGMLAMDLMPALRRLGNPGMT